MREWLKYFVQTFNSRKYFMKLKKTKERKEEEVDRRQKKRKTEGRNKRTESGRRKTWRMKQKHGQENEKDKRKKKKIKNKKKKEEKRQNNWRSSSFLASSWATFCCNIALRSPGCVACRTRCSPCSRRRRAAAAWASPGGGPGWPWGRCGTRWVDSQTSEQQNVFQRLDKTKPFNIA